MKPTILLGLSLLISSFIYSQRPSLNISSDNGEKFYVYIDGKPQNRTPVARLSINTTRGKALLKIVFVNKSTGSISQYIYPDRNESTSYVLRKKRPEYYLEKTGYRGNQYRAPYNRIDTFYSDRHSNDYIQNGALCSGPVMSDVSFLRAKKEVSDASLSYKKTQAIKRIIENNCMQASQVADLIDMSADYTTDQLEIAKLGYMHSYDTENFDEVVDAIASERDRAAFMVFARTGGNDIVRQPMPEYREERQPLPRQDPRPERNECRTPSLNSTQFNDALQSVRSASFDQTKVEQAKLIASSNCLSVSQVRDIMKTFSFEENKLDFAKYAYDRTCERNNYYLVNQEFTFETNRSALTEYIKGR